MDYFNDEFQESDIMFSDYSSDNSVESNDDTELNKQHYNQSDGKLKRRKSINKKPRVSSSIPINIPLGSSSYSYDFNETNYRPSEGGFDDDDGEEEMRRMPPHVIVERRINGEMARSYSPLKGKNLCLVRNSILRMTGFLE